jgi:iron(III) transport system ATP-binding protein
MSKLALRNIGKRFGDSVAVEGVDLELESGEFVSLLGPSGCGKTTTLRMIAGFIDPTTGTIETDGKVLSSPQGSVPPERRQMSMIFQSYAIWPNMTVEENVAFGLKLRRLPVAEVRKRVGAIRRS